MIFVTVSVFFSIITQFCQTIIHNVLFVCPNWLFIIVLVFVRAPHALRPVCVCVGVCACACVCVCVHVLVWVGMWVWVGVLSYSSFF